MRPASVKQKKNTRQSRPKEHVTPPRNQPIQPIQPTKGAKHRKSVKPVHRTIMLLQKSTACQIPKAPFARLVREIMNPLSSHIAPLRMTATCLEALREASEAYITQVFQDAYAITINRKQVTLHPRDVQLLMFLRGPR